THNLGLAVHISNPIAGADPGLRVAMVALLVVGPEGAMLGGAHRQFFADNILNIFERQELSAPVASIEMSLQRLILPQHGPRLSRPPRFESHAKRCGPGQRP